MSLLAVAWHFISENGSSTSRRAYKCAKSIDRMRDTTSAKECVPAVAYSWSQEGLSKVEDVTKQLAAAFARAIFWFASAHDEITAFVNFQIMPSEMLP
eukprot:2348484-Amphidinium_carterae.1